MQKIWQDDYYKENTDVYYLPLQGNRPFRFVETTQLTSSLIFDTRSALHSTKHAILMAPIGCPTLMKLGNMPTAHGGLMLAGCLQNGSSNAVACA